MNKKLRTGLTLMLLLFFGLTSFAPLTQAASIIAQPGDNNGTVGEINLMLKDLGYYYGTVTNTFGTATKSAIILFQRANGLAATGTVDQVTYDVLTAKYAGKGQADIPVPAPEPIPGPSPAPLPAPTPAPVPETSDDVIAKPGDISEVVGQINTMLKSLGYYFASPSFYYTTSTKYAVARFQADNALPATGIVDNKTYDLLKSKYQAGVPAPAPAPSPAPVQIAGLSAEEQLMFDMVNQERVKAGIKPLLIDMRMVKSARLKSQDLITNNYFAHTSPVYGSFATLIRTYAPDYSYIGENLAGNKTVSLAMTAFMNSSGHRKNILNPNYTHIGVGIISGGPYGKMFTQHFGG